MAFPPLPLALALPLRGFETSPALPVLPELAFCEALPDRAEDVDPLESMLGAMLIAGPFIAVLEALPELPDVARLPLLVAFPLPARPALPAEFVTCLDVFQPLVEPLDVDDPPFPLALAFPLEGAELRFASPVLPELEFCDAPSERADDWLMVSAPLLLEPLLFKPSGDQRP